MYVDSHCHLEGPRFADDREQVLEHARAAGIEAIVAIGNGDGPDDVACGIRLAEDYQQQVPRSARDDSRLKIFATIGIHPHEARLAEDRHYAEMEKLARNPRVIAWGEIGLDYHYDHSPRDVQQKVFVQQMELAHAAKLPIVIHNRPSDNSENAWNDLFRLLREHWTSSGLGGILHCFTGTMEHARQGLDLGFLISFAGNVSYPKATNIRDAAKHVPLDRMLIETDSPYLAPIPYRGKRNEPAYVAETARHIGELRGISAEEVGAATTENFFRFLERKD
ncbi:MAG: TatD family hydrolase [Terriglobales bacterium]